MSKVLEGLIKTVELFFSIFLLFFKICSLQQRRSMSEDEEYENGNEYEENGDHKKHKKDKKKKHKKDKDKKKVITSTMFLD